jgi:CDGSH-type Zn-finger protein
MGICKCGFTRDGAGNCDGTHKVVREMKQAKPDITDEEFEMALQAIFGPYKGPGWSPE